MSITLPILDTDPTLDAADRALEESENSRPPREYLGMSGIGHPCSRKTWYDWRWASQNRHNAETLKRFEDGHHGEDVQAKRLRLVNGLTLITMDPETGRQIGYSDLNDHFKGHCDGVVLGLLQAKSTWHIWEHKQVGEKKQAQLVKLKAKHGEKAALQQWDETYYAQAILYMYYSGMTRHYLTCSTPGGRSTVSVRTNADPEQAMRLIAKANQILDSQHPPHRISESVSWYQCGWCQHKDTCHNGQLPERNCRTCLFSSPVQGGQWHCNFHNTQLSSQMQRQGCNRQRFVPSLIKGQQIDAADDGQWVEYLMPDGSTWRDE